MISILALSEPMTLEAIVKKYGIPVVLYRDSWNNKMKFVMTKFHKSTDQIHVIGYFVYAPAKQDHEAQLFCTECKYRVSLGDPEDLLHKETYK